MLFEGFESLLDDGDWGFKHGLGDSVLSYPLDFVAGWITEARWLRDNGAYLIAMPYEEFFNMFCREAEAGERIIFMYPEADILEAVGKHPSKNLLFISRGSANVGCVVHNAIGSASICAALDSRIYVDHALSNVPFPADLSKASLDRWFSSLSADDSNFSPATYSACRLCLNLVSLPEKEAELVLQRACPTRLHERGIRPIDCPIRAYFAAREHEKFSFIQGNTFATDG